MKSQLIILDFGSQYTQLIARSVRELGVYCEILPGTVSAEEFAKYEAKAIILSGGPASVHGSKSPRVAAEILHSGLPILGICYGMQLIAMEYGGKVGGWGEESAEAESSIREFGPAAVKVLEAMGPLSAFSCSEQLDVWMSHGDKVLELPQGFTAIAESKGSPIAAFGDSKRGIFGVQFHPEVHHTARGKEVLSSFLFNTLQLKKDWDPAGFIEETVSAIADKVSKGNVVCGLSGGVDSTVAAVLVNRAIGERLHCIFVDNGLLRQGEADQVYRDMSELGLNVHMVDAGERFLSELRGVSDPEQKRKIIGRVFIEVFEAEAHRISDVAHLVQGTLYPDVIESVSVVGESATIKSHHNVGGLTEDMKLDLIEPLRELFKDEVRAIGRELNIPEHCINRQPFPGPGLAVRCLGEITADRLRVLRSADMIVREEVEEAGLGLAIWQYFAVLLPVRSVGVMGDVRTYDECVAVRAITSRDGMTADWYPFSEAVLRRMSSRIVNETAGVNRVVYDISTKPPSTIEWE